MNHIPKLETVVLLSDWKETRPQSDDLLATTTQCLRTVVPVDWVTLVSSALQRLDAVARPGGVPLLGQIMKFELRREPQLARVEESRPAHYALELRECNQPLTPFGPLCKWILTECILDERGNILVAGNREALLRADSRAVAEAVFHSVSQGDILSDMPISVNGVVTALVREDSKLLVLADLHPQIIKALGPTTETIGTADLAIRKGKAYKDFAIDIYSIWKYVLPPLDSVSPRELKDFARRRLRYDWVNRYLVKYWLSKKLDTLTDKQLVGHFASFLRKELAAFQNTPLVTFDMKPKTLRKRAHRLELYSKFEGPHPRQCPSLLSGDILGS